MRSALRDLRHLGAIPRLASLLGDDSDRSAKGKRIVSARETRTRRAYTEESASLDPALRPYLLSRQHDAVIEGFHREGDRFRVTAYDERCEELGAPGFSWGEIQAPFDLVFEGTCYVGWRRLENERLVFASEPRGPIDWLCDALIDPELPGVRWALVYYVSGTRREDRHHLLLVEAKRVRVVERQRETWLAHFGEGEIDRFDRAMAEREA